VWVCPRHRRTKVAPVFSAMLGSKDRRPQLIDQGIAVANLLSLVDAGQSVPQRQQPLAAERGSVQFLIRCDGNLAVIDCRRRLAAQRDPVVANDLDAH
ncbi:MAG: hypothetical protein WCA23_24725, partial [Stellaceae bacterium]